MISILRDFTKTWIFKGLMILIAASFIGVGGASYFSGSNSTDVIVAGNVKVTAAEFKANVDSMKRYYETQGQTITNEQLIAENIPGRLLAQLTDRKATIAWLDRLGVRPSSKLILAEVAKIPLFFNSVTGRFDMDTYRQQLASRDMTDKMFEADLREQIAEQQYISSAQAGLEAPRVFAATDAAFGLQSRDASMFFLSPQNVTMPGEPTQADIETFYKANLQRFTLPESRAASVITFSVVNYAKSVSVSDEDLRQLYESRRASLATPEVRTFVQVRAPDMAAANKVSAALKAGRSAEEAAKANKGEVISYSLRPQTAVADDKIAEAAFKMQTGEISAPVQGTLGISVIKMGEIKIGSAPSFESARAQLDEELRRQRATEKLNEATNAFADALAKGEEFDAAARRLNLTVAPLEPITADGMGRSGTNYSTYGALVKGIFDLPQVGSVSEVLPLGEGEYFALKLTGLQPSGAPPLAQVQAELAVLWRREKAAETINAEADKAMARLAKGETLAAVAASYKAEVRSQKAITLQTAQQMQMPQAVAARVFSSKAGETFVAEMPVQGVPAVAIGRLDAIHQGDATQANTMATMSKAQASQALGQDMGTVIQKNARVAVKAKSNTEAAYRALGLEPPAAAGSESSSKAGSKS
ncbi:rotamase family protein [Asticcacaulis biprosthecium C19]|uniref:Parvulin-like PPIase n=1 Tax=Asticcacaulis biprosthecium C19 TaxID=715226 RepID=F4QQN8_9CAUL|nr:peptidylprolyl isomerase [Asticcacaulis biprosthecium]EGF90525.1 rotamase family protein [Asticcacaulis biprosthecium C19]